MDPIKSVSIRPTRRNGKRAAAPLPPAAVRVAVPPAETAASDLPLYHVGERLMLLGGGNRWSRSHAPCEVLAVLPKENSPQSYRVRSDAESYERIVVETDLTPLG